MSRMKIQKYKYHGLFFGSLTVIIENCVQNQEGANHTLGWVAFLTKGTDKNSEYGSTKMYKEGCPPFPIPAIIFIDAIYVLCEIQTSKNILNKNLA